MSPTCTRDSMSWYTSQSTHTTDRSAMVNRRLLIVERAHARSAGSLLIDDRP